MRRDSRVRRSTPEPAPSEHTLGAERLDPPLLREPQVVVEVKHLGRCLPDWVLALAGSSNAEGYSKFAVGMAQLQACAMGSSVGG